MLMFVMVNGSISNIYQKVGNMLLRLDSMISRAKILHLVSLSNFFKIKIERNPPDLWPKRKENKIVINHKYAQVLNKIYIYPSIENYPKRHNLLIYHFGGKNYTSVSI